MDNPPSHEDAMARRAEEAARAHFPAGAGGSPARTGSPQHTAAARGTRPSRLNRILRLSELKTHLEGSRDAWLGCNAAPETKARKVKELEGHLALVEELKRETAGHHSPAARGTEYTENE